MQTLTDDQYRIFYSAFYGDLNSLKILKAQGLLKVDITDKDGRSPLSVAASEGNLEVVQYLIRNKANYAIRDARNNDALSDAKREAKD